MKLTSAEATASMVAAGNRKYSASFQLVIVSNASWKLTPLQINDARELLNANKQLRGDAAPLGRAGLLLENPAPFRSHD